MQGFSLTELMVVLALCAASVVLLGRDAALVRTQTAAWLDRAADQLRHARARAQAERCPVRAELSAAEIRLSYPDPTCASGTLTAANHSGEASVQRSPVLADALGTHTVIFDAGGRAVDATGAPASLLIAAGARRLRVDGNVGTIVLASTP
ncbi:pilus assembly FimT family protein [Sinimarinibacterium flocculans]|uniref:pilus assembly FimT family protein n=1 Tax=Sinimarinibacterium flocculans TaxID=985250 RepID=UPI003514A174